MAWFALALFAYGNEHTADIETRGTEPWLFQALLRRLRGHPEQDEEEDAGEARVNEKKPICTICESRQEISIARSPADMSLAEAVPSAWLGARFAGPKWRND